MKITAFALAIVKLLVCSVALHNGVTAADSSEAGASEDTAEENPGADRHSRFTEPAAAPYVKVINGRCGEEVGALPFGEPGSGWATSMDEDARSWCNARPWCVGYMRYLGNDAKHCDAWCGRPQFCGTLELTEDDSWVSYLRHDAAAAVGGLNSLPDAFDNMVSHTQDEADLESNEGDIDNSTENDVQLAGGLDTKPEHEETISLAAIDCVWPYEGLVALWSVDNVKALTAEHDAGGFFHDEGDEVCHVLYHQRGSEMPWQCSGEEECIGGHFTGILSESEELVPFFTSNSSIEPWIYAFDGNEYIGETVGSGNGFGPKKHFLSVFFVSEDSTCDGRHQGQWSPAEAEQALPGHVYVDDGTPELRRQAFSPYHFTVICGSLEDSGFVPQPVVDAFGFAAHPLVPKDVYARFKRVFFHLPDATQPFSRIHPAMLESYVEDLYTDPDKNEAIYFKQTFMFLMQDLFRYRYRQTPRERLEIAACALCTESKRRKRLAEVAPSEAVDLTTTEPSAVGVVVCVMSRRSGHVLRHAIRETWATKLASAGGETARSKGRASLGAVALRFFVGSNGQISGNDAATYHGVGMEHGDIEDFNAGDVVELHAPEAYKAVTLKAFSMVEWAHREFPNMRFMVRADDDIYLRPMPLMRQLESRPPVMYLWGNIDHGSNPVRDPEHPHYNSEEQFPKVRHPLFGDIFPPYARGHLWVMSADLAALIASAWRGELGNVGGSDALSMELASVLPHPDDPALGYALSVLINEGRISLNIDDRDMNVFALNPSCNATYLNIHNRTMVVHHVNAEIMRCMWAIDDAADEGGMPDLCPCSVEVEEEEDPYDIPFDYPRARFNE